MSTTIFEENWTPLSVEESQSQEEELKGEFYINNLSSNVKPQKLARYQFGYQQLINYKAEGVLLGYEQSGDQPVEDEDYNLTDYIPVVGYRQYAISVFSGMTALYGVKYISFFDGTKQYKDSISYEYGTTRNIITIPYYASYIKLSIYKEDWNKIAFGCVTGSILQIEHTASNKYMSITYNGAMVASSTGAAVSFYKIISGSKIEIDIPQACDDTGYIIGYTDVIGDNLLAEQIAIDLSSIGTNAAYSRTIQQAPGYQYLAICYIESRGTPRIIQTPYQEEGNIILNNKGIVPLNIINNQKNSLIYKDLKLEVFVKEEAIIKDFVRNFNLTDFLDVHHHEDSNNLRLYTKTQLYYNNYNIWVNWVPSYPFTTGDLIKHSDGYPNETYHYICLYSHTSGTDWYSQILIGNTYYYEYQLWGKLDDENVLSITKEIKESNYQSNYPYVTEFIFKNIWGCDMINYLNTYVKNSALAISYYDFFAKNLRMLTSEYTRYYEQGYFDSDKAINDYDVDGYGIRMIFGESFENDELLGKNKLNNYFPVIEKGHYIAEDWVSSDDTVVQDIFGLRNAHPFDHYYTYNPKIGLPFFKEKSFNDSYIRLVLEKFDVLGNLYKRIVNLPVLLTFTNNLIKVYFQTAELIGSSKYCLQYLNSNVEHNYEVGLVGASVTCNVRAAIWCPDVTKLSVSSTIIGLGEVIEQPKLQSQRSDVNNLSGQICELFWTFQRGGMDVGDIMRAVHTIEYSDGSNYDKFIYIENIKRTS